MPERALPALADPQVDPPPASAGGAPSRSGPALVVALALLGLVLVLAARTSPASVEARLGNRVELVELIAAEQARVAALDARVEELSAQVEQLRAEGSRGQAAVEALHERIDVIAAPAGMTGVAGDGLVVTLSDSSLAESPTGDLNDLVIHEQDLQAVINGLWAGGAEAMTVNGERILATTAIRCVGNTLLLHGAVYSPPYVIAAVGDEVALRDALARDPVVAGLRDAAQRFSLGFSVQAAEDLVLPAAGGTGALQVARPGGTVEG